MVVVLVGDAVSAAERGPEALRSHVDRLLEQDPLRIMHMPSIEGLRRSLADEVLAGE